MNEKTKTGLEILQAAVLLGVLGDVLLRRMPWGLNVLLFIGALVAAFVMLVWRRKRDFWNAQTIALNGALVFFAACFAWRDSIELNLLSALAILAILSALILPALQIKTHLAGVFHYLVGFFWSGLNAAFAPFVLLFEDVEWKTIPQNGWKKHLVAVLRGVAIATPLVFVFGALFMAADAVFEGLVEKTLNIQPDVIVSHVFFIGFFFWVTAGYLRGALVESFTADVKKTFFEPEKTEVKSPIPSVTEIKEDETPKPVEEPKKEKRRWQDFDNTILPRSFTLGAIEIGVVLGLVNLLFLSFVIVQLPYLFGGFELVQQTENLKLADYARRGFGELVTVAALVLPILLASHWLVRKDSPIAEKLYRGMAVVQIFLLFVIMMSAAQRLFVLTGNLGYGLTTVRFYPMVFMIWLAIVFVWFTLTVLRGARAKFAWGALWSAFAVLGVLHFFNPDGYIVRTNVRLMQEGRSFDAWYNSSLSDDAVPELLDSLPFMDFEHQCVAKFKLKKILSKAESKNDVRSWNFSRWRAHRLMSKDSDDFDLSNCQNKLSYMKNWTDGF